MNITRIELRECVEIPAPDWSPTNNSTYIQMVDETDPKDLVGRNTFWTAYWPNKDAPYLPMAQVDFENLQGLLTTLQRHFAHAGTEMRPFKENDK
jgi:hypothetical protein